MTITKEQRNDALKWLWKQVKAFSVGISSGIVVLWTVAQLYLDGYVDDKIKAHQTKIEEERRKNKPMREILGEELHIAPEIVPYEIAEKLNELDSLIRDVKKFSEEYLPIMEHEQSIIPLYRYIDRETGQEYKWMPDGRPHPVMYDNGNAWIVYHSQRKDL